MKPGRFHGKLVTESVADGWERVIQNSRCPFYYETSYGRIIKPEHGSLTDLGSTPRVLWTIFPPHYLKPCVVCHDWDYDRHSVSRKQADLDLREMIYTYTMGDALLRRNCYWIGVRTGGWYAWRKAPNRELYALSRA